MSRLENLNQQRTYSVSLQLKNLVGVLMPKSTDLPAIHEWSQGTGLPWDVEHLFIIQHSKPFPSVAFCPCPIFSTSILYYNPMQLICRIGLLHPSVDGLSVLFNSSSLRCDAPPLTGRKPTATFHSNSTQHHSGPWETVKTIVALKRFSSIKAFESNSIVPWLDKICHSCPADICLRQV